MLFKAHGYFVQKFVPLSLFACALRFVASYRPCIVHTKSIIDIHSMMMAAICSLASNRKTKSISFIFECIVQLLRAYGNLCISGMSKPFIVFVNIGKSIE